METDLKMRSVAKKKKKNFMCENVTIKHWTGLKTTSRPNRPSSQQLNETNIILME